MLSKERRLPKDLFKDLLTSRRFIQSENFTLRIAPSSNPRIGISVSKKISKLAVVRNRIRRRAYAAMPKEVKGGLYLFIAKPGAREIKGEKLKQELADMLQKSYNL